MGYPALATRHLTFLLQTMFHHLNPNERKDFALQLQNVSQQCEGAPVPLVSFETILIECLIEFKNLIEGFGFRISHTTG